MNDYYILSTVPCAREAAVNKTLQPHGAHLLMKETMNELSKVNKYSVINPKKKIKQGAVLERERTVLDGMSRKDLSEKKA